MKKDNDKSEKTIVFSKIDPDKYKDKDLREDDKNYDLERTQEIKLVKKNPSAENETEEKASASSVEDEEDEVDFSEVRRERNRAKRFRVAIRLTAVAVVLAIGVCAYGTRELWVPKLEGILDNSHETIVNDGVTESGNFPIEFDEASTDIITRLDNNIIIADGGHIYFYDANGKLRDTVYHNFASPVIRTEGKRMLCFDNGGNSFKVYSKSGEIYEKELDDSIIYAALSSNGSVAVVSQDDKYTAMMRVFDASGTEIYNWSCGERIMDISFNSDGSGCYIVSFEASDGIIMSQVHYIEFDTSDEKVTGEQLDGLVLEVRKNDNGKIWAVGDEKLYLLDLDAKIIDTYEYGSDLVSFDLSDSCAAVVTEGSSRDSTKVAIFDSSDTDKAEPAIVESSDASPIKARCEDDKTFVMTENSIDCYSVGGSLLATAEITSDYSDFVYYDSAIYFLGLRQADKISFDT